MLHDNYSPIKRHEDKFIINLAFYDFFLIWIKLVLVFLNIIYYRRGKRDAKVFNVMPQCAFMNGALSVSRNYGLSSIITLQLIQKILLYYSHGMTMTNVFVVSAIKFHIFQLSKEGIKMYQRGRKKRWGHHVECESFKYAFCN